MAIEVFGFGGFAEVSLFVLGFVGLVDTTLVDASQGPIDFNP